MPKNRNFAPPKRRGDNTLTEGKLTQFRTFPFDYQGGYGEIEALRNPGEEEHLPGVTPETALRNRARIDRMRQDWRRYRPQIVSWLEMAQPGEPLPDICVLLDSEMTEGEAPEIEIKGERIDLSIYLEF
jgi:hypothetical protein